MKKAVKYFCMVLLVAVTVVLGAVAYYDVSLGDSYFITEGNKLCLYGNSFVKCRECRNGTAEAIRSVDTADKSYNVDLSLLGVVPIKTVSVTVAEQSDVAILGSPFGVKIHSDGVMVVGFNDVNTHVGTVNPAINAGIKAGDAIIEIGGKKTANNSEVQSIIEASEGKTLTFTVKRDGKIFPLDITPVKSSLDGRYKAGIWIRDSSAGVGTLTFYSPSLGVVAGLGHGICDSDTDSLIPLESGQFVGAEIIGISKSSPEKAGELQGILSGGKIADFEVNDQTGVFGVCCTNIETASVVPVAMKQEVTLGAATVVTTLDSSGPKAYDCEIKKIYYNDNSKIKNMVIKITDSKLLETTGGIVQGMSGSPILQNGKFVGAVTHVFVDDCTSGYAIFAENMLMTAQSAAKD